MINQLSILIPTYNEDCTSQVTELQHCANSINGLQYEIIVSDDASTNQEIAQKNAQIESMYHCRLLRQPSNIGRAANRNFLVKQARYDWLLFLDCNVGIIDENFIKNYLTCDKADVVSGGVTIKNDPQLSSSNLRYKYEQKIAPKHTAQQRQMHPYQSFRTTNFMARREMMLTHLFDEAIARYGYEDVLFGKHLCDANITIQHTENPVVLTHFEANENYMAKLEEAMHTLHDLQDELRGYSPLLSTAERLKKTGMLAFTRSFFRKVSQSLRKNLTGAQPRISWLNPYKLGYFLSIDE
ncbi:MAG: glycosyltransferase family 2 protein [Bacteroidales bacterium]|nr:glycosyltransferase family 2 protein [Bacteroidales bacterium]